MTASLTDRFIFGTKDVATPGTAVQLDGTDQRIRSVMLIAHSDNAGRIFYGGSDSTNWNVRRWTCDEPLHW